MGKEKTLGKKKRSPTVSLLKILCVIDSFMTLILSGWTEWRVHVG